MRQCENTRWFQVSLKIHYLLSRQFYYLFIYLFFLCIFLHCISPNAEKRMYRVIHERFCFACCFFPSSTTRWSSLFLGTSAEMVTTAVKILTHLQEHVLQARKPLKFRCRQHELNEKFSPMTQTLH